MHSGAHFDPQLGLDIHTYPWPLPTPHIGIVFDVFDYLPLLGTTVHVNSIKRAAARARRPADGRRAVYGQQNRRRRW